MSVKESYDALLTAPKEISIYLIYACEQSQKLQPGQSVPNCLRSSDFKTANSKEMIRKESPSAGEFGWITCVIKENPTCQVKIPHTGDR
jgi:hypothetical protein